MPASITRPLLFMDLLWSRISFFIGVAVAWPRYGDVVTLPNGDGSVRGLTTDMWRSFRGIPFAEPPLGPLRFLPPERNKPWAPEILDATDFKPNCAQSYVKDYPDWTGFNLTIDEDCLYLNVFTPNERSQSQLLPVAFFIYGGGHYTGGANDEQLYAWRTAAELNMIIVTFNYRLGFFGWLGSEELRSLAKDGSTGNAGFLDQRMALKWVQRNIRAFHGDPRRVLLFGESSGAADVSSHMVSPGSQGLFQRAMMQSGGFTSWSYVDMHKTQANYDFLLNVTGCSRSKPFAVQCLQAFPWWNLSKTLDKLYTEFPYSDGWRNSSLAPTMDGVTLVGPTDVLAMQGKVAAVPVLIGCNKDEGVAFLSKTRTSQSYIPMTMTERMYIKWAHRNFPEQWATEILKRYSVSEFTPFFSAANAVGDYVVRCPTHRAMHYLTQPRSMGRDLPKQAPVFAYVFSHNPVSKALHSGGPCSIGSEGAFHGAEIPFFMDVRNFFSTQYERSLGLHMATYLRNFAWSGNPNQAPRNAETKLPGWPEFLNGTSQALQLTTLPEGNISVTTKLDTECQLMDAYWRAGQPDPPNSDECVNDDQTTDVNGNTCSSYYKFTPFDCGKFDSEEFIAQLQCCACMHVVGSETTLAWVPNISTVTVTLPNGDGSVRGHATEHWRTFRGIPFAKPPLGPLRFLPPERNDPWYPRVLDALDFKANCLQSNYIESWQADAVGLINSSFDEDCLYLNVFAPSRHEHGNHTFPVAAYLYDSGGADNDALDLWRTAKESKMIIVTFNYRMGIWGALGSEELRGYAKDNSTGNAGFLDQRLALKWVQENIEAFHGDPGRVLFLGTSSGASYVSAHLVSPGSSSLFQRAMMMSGAFRTGGEKNMHVAQANFDFIAAKTGCKATKSHVVDCLQSLPSDVLQNFLAFRPRNKGYMGDLPFPSGWSNSSWAPTIDGVILTAPAFVLARRGHISKVPIIVGSSQDAGTSILTQCRTCRRYVPMTIGERAYGRWVQANFPEPWASDIVSTYRVSDLKPFWAAAAALTDHVFKCPSVRAEKMLAGHLHSAQIFVYNFIIDPVSPLVRPLEWGYAGSPCTAGSQGVATGSDALFFLKSRRRLATTYEEDIATSLLQYLRNFAWSGDPNVFPPWLRKNRSLIHWPAYENRTHMKLWIGPPTQGNITVQNDTRGLRCAVWNAYWMAGEPLPQDGLRSNSSLENVFV